MAHSAWTQITSLGEEQYGLVTCDQAAEAGLSRRAVERAVADGRLYPERRRVYAIAGAPGSEWRPLMAACLSAGTFAAASHFSAGWVHSSPWIAPGSLELTFYGDSSYRLVGVRCHRSQFLKPEDLTIARKIPVTTPARTVMDIAASVSATLLVKVLDDFIRRHLCSNEDVSQTLERIGGRGRAGTAWLRVLVEERFRPDWAPGDNDWELDLARALTAAGYPPVLQFQVVVGKRVFLIDLAFPQYKIGVEFKGWDPRSVRSGFDHDAERDLLLTGEGWLIISATSKTKPADLIRAVQVAISRQQLAGNHNLDVHG